MDEEKVFGYPEDIMRFSWGTTKEILKTKNAVVVRW